MAPSNLKQIAARHKRRQRSVSPALYMQLRQSFLERCLNARNLLRAMILLHRCLRAPDCFFDGGFIDLRRLQRHVG